MKSNFLNLKKNFSIPKGTIYLCGNSLGPPLKSMGSEVKKFVDEEWAKEKSNKIVLIGKNLDHQSIKNQLSSCRFNSD